MSKEKTPPPDPIAALQAQLADLQAAVARIEQALARLAAQPGRTPAETKQQLTRIETIALNASLKR